MDRLLLKIPKRVSNKYWFTFCAFSAEVRMPSGKVDKPVIQDNRDGTVSVKYDPREEGSHDLVVKYNGEPVQGEWIGNTKKFPSKSLTYFFPQDLPSNSTLTQSPPAM